METENATRQELVRLFSAEPFCHFTKAILEFFVKSDRRSKFVIDGVDLAKEHDQGMLISCSQTFGPHIFYEFVTTAVLTPKGVATFKSRISRNAHPRRVTFQLKDDKTALITSWFAKKDIEDADFLLESSRMYFYPPILNDLIASMDFSKAPPLPIKWKLLSRPAQSKGTAIEFICERSNFNRALHETNLRTIICPDHELWIAPADVNVDEKLSSTVLILTFSFTTGFLQNYLAVLVHAMISSIVLTMH